MELREKDGKLRGMKEARILPAHTLYSRVWTCCVCGRKQAPIAAKVPAKLLSQITPSLNNYKCTWCGTPVSYKNYARGQHRKNADGIDRSGLIYEVERAIINQGRGSDKYRIADKGWTCTCCKRDNSSSTNRCRICGVVQQSETLLAGQQSDAGWWGYTMSKTYPTENGRSGQACTERAATAMQQKHARIQRELAGQTKWAAYGSYTLCVLQLIWQ